MNVKVGDKVKIDVEYCPRMIVQEITEDDKGKAWATCIWYERNTHRFEKAELLVDVLIQI